MNEAQKEIFDTINLKGAFKVQEDSSVDDIKVALGATIASFLYSWNAQIDLDSLNQDMTDIADIAFQAVKLLSENKI